MPIINTTPFVIPPVGPITDWTDNTFWTAETAFLGSSLVWTGSGWNYDGDYGGCDGCTRNLLVAGSWYVGFRPSGIEFDVTVTGTQGNDGYIYLVDSGSNTLISGSPIIPGIASPGSYTKSFPLDFTPNLDIAKFGLFMGPCDTGCTNTDRDFTITGIRFT